jgi:hypothetical protein
MEGGFRVAPEAFGRLTNLVIYLAVLSCVLCTTTSFTVEVSRRPAVLSRRYSWQHQRVPIILEAKRSKKNRSSGQGFASETIKDTNDDSAQIATADMSKSSDVAGTGMLLTSISEPSSASVIPSSTAEMLPSTLDQRSAEERTKALLKEKYGMRTAAEQLEAERQQTIQNERRLEQKKLLDKIKSDPNFDIFQILPAPLLIGIDRFLKAGLAICVFLFVSAGILVTLEAGNAALKLEQLNAGGSSSVNEGFLPESLSTFITETIEPNFTPGLLVLLGFSVTLGLFSAAQLGSSGASYREDGN